MSTTAWLTPCVGDNQPPQKGYEVRKFEDFILLALTLKLLWPGEMRYPRDSSREYRLGHNPYPALDMAPDGESHRECATSSRECPGVDACPLPDVPTRRRTRVPRPGG